MNSLLKWLAIANTSILLSSFAMSNNATDMDSYAPGLIEISSEFPGGNIELLSISDQKVKLRPDLTNTDGHWFYWNFEVTGAQGRELDFEFVNGKAMGPRGPAVSHDNGETWQWLNASNLPAKEGFSYTFGHEDESVRFAFCMPYTLENWYTFAETLPQSFEHGILCISRQGREVPIVRIKPKSEDVSTVVITARLHACEAPGSYVIEGFLEEWAKSGTEHANLIAIPIVDIDGVQLGEQGKNRIPRDHNRDFDEKPLYPESIAIKKLVSSLEGPIYLLDLHAPYIRHGDSETVYFVGPADEEMAKAQNRFSEMLQKSVTGLPYKVANNIPFGEKWNTAANFKKGKSLAAWSRALPNTELSTIVEIPYANAEGVEVTAASSREFGRSLARVLMTYITHK